MAVKIIGIPIIIIEMFMTVMQMITVIILFSGRHNWGINELICLPGFSAFQASMADGNGQHALCPWPSSVRTFGLQVTASCRQVTLQGWDESVARVYTNSPTNAALNFTITCFGYHYRVCMSVLLYTVQASTLWLRKFLRRWRRDIRNHKVEVTCYNLVRNSSRIFANILSNYTNWPHPEQNTNGIATV